MRSLQQLLWSDLKTFPDGSGPSMPSSVPAVGLPYRVAAFLLAEAFRHHSNVLQVSCGAAQLWGVQELQWPVVAAARRSQFELRPEVAIGQSTLRLSASQSCLFEPAFADSGALPIHAAFLILETTTETPSPDFLIHWHHALSFISAIDGSERMLDEIWQSAPSAIPFEERWSTRSRLPMPSIVWQWLDEMARVARTGDVASTRWQQLKAEVLSNLEQEFAQQPLVLPDEFLAERCDVSFGSPDSPEFPCAVERREMSPHQPTPRVPVETPTLAEKLGVRIAQLTSQPLEFWTGFPERFPNLRRVESQRVFRQVTQAFQSEGDGPSWEFAVFPEVCLPFDGRRRFEKLVSETGRAAVIGCLWHEVAPALKPISRASLRHRYFVNEALLSIPMPKPQRRRPIVRSFLVRKPLPTHSEVALAKRLSELVGLDDAWKILPGRRVFRFVHPTWGDFTVAICSDLLDPAPWHSMRGQLLHLFLCSYNPDVALFDSLTWVRAYENFANLVATNCGAFGGSFAWSPRSREKKEVARIRGNGLFVLADVDLPVKSLFDWQIQGIDASVNAEIDLWKVKAKLKLDFKSPPPGFLSRNRFPGTLSAIPEESATEVPPGTSVG